MIIHYLIIHNWLSGCVLHLHFLVPLSCGTRRPTPTIQDLTITYDYIRVHLQHIQHMRVQNCAYGVRCRLSSCGTTARAPSRCSSTWPPSSGVAVAVAVAADAPGARAPTRPPTVHCPTPTPSHILPLTT